MVAHVRQEEVLPGRGASLADAYSFTSHEDFAQPRKLLFVKSLLACDVVLDLSSARFLPSSATKSVRPCPQSGPPVASTLRWRGIQVPKPSRYFSSGAISLSHSITKQMS